MAKPFAVIGLTFTATLILLNFVFDKSSQWMFMLFIAVYAVLLPVKKFRRTVIMPTFILSAAAACLLFYFVTESEYSVDKSFIGENVAISGIITELSDEPNDSGRYHFTIKTKSVGGVEHECKIRFSSSSKPNAELYDFVDFVGTVYVIGENNESYHRYYKSKRIYLGAYTYSDVTFSHNDDKPFYFYIINERLKSVRILNNLFDEHTAGFMRSLLFGDTRSMSESMLEDMRNTGVAHLVAVSGMHMNAWAYMLYSLLKRRNVNHKLSCLICIVAVVLIISFCSFGISALRAGIMMLLYFAAELIDRRSESFNSLGFAALALSVVNPYVVCDVSFLLSFSATLGIMVVNSVALEMVEAWFMLRVSPKLQKPLFYLTSTILISIAASVFVFPITSVYFGTVSTYSVIVNLFVNPLCMLCMFLSGVLTLLGGIVWAREPLVFVIQRIYTFVESACHKFALLPFAVQRTDYSYVYLWCSLCIIAIVAVLTVVKNKKKAFIKICCGMLCLLIVFNVSYGAVSRNTIKVNVLPVGCGTAVLLSHDGHGMLIGCGGDYYAPLVINNEIDRRNINLDSVFVPRSAQTESNAVNKVAQSHPLALIFNLDSTASIDVDYNVVYINGMNNQVIADSIVMSTYTDGNYNFAIVDVYNTRLIINFIPGVDLSAFSQLIDSCDVLITRAAIPVGVDVSTFEAVYISDAVNRYEATEERVNVTAVDGKLSLVICPQKCYINAVRQTDSLLIRTVKEVREWLI